MNSADLNDLLDKMDARRQELWNAYMDGPGGHTEALRQGKFEGFNQAFSLVSAASRAKGAKS